MVASTGAYSTIPLFPLFHSSTLPRLLISHISATRKPNLRKPSAPSLLLPEDPASLLHLVLPISSSAGYLGYLGVNQLVGSPSFAFFPFAGRFSRAHPRLVVPPAGLVSAMARPRLEVAADPRSRPEATGHHTRPPSQGPRNAPVS